MNDGIEVVMKLIKPIKPITIFGDLCHNIFVRYSNNLLIAWIVSVIEEKRHVCDVF